MSLKNILLTRWQMLGERDRWLLLGWGTAMGLALLWFGVIAPLSRRLVTLEQHVPELESQLNRMRAQSMVLGRPDLTTPSAEGDLRSTLFAALAQRKLNAELRALSTSRVEIRLPELPLREALELLQSLRNDSGSRVATLTLKSDKPEEGDVRIVAELEQLP